MITLLKVNSMEKRLFLVQCPDKENAEFIREKHLETLRKEGFFVLTDEIKEINYKWQVRILAEEPQGELFE